MFNFIKKLTFISLVLLSFTTVSHAQATNLDSVKNVGEVLLNQFDVSDLVEDFKVDLYFNTNACKEADRLNVLSAQDQITNNLLTNFNKINESQRNQLIIQYQSLEVELEFLRELNILIEDGFDSGIQNHKSAIKSSLNSKLHPLVESNYDQLHKKYENRVQVYDEQSKSYKAGLYSNCPNSWLSLKERVSNIQQEIAQIQKEWDSFKNSGKNLASTAKNTTSLSNLKSILVQTKDNALDGVSNSWSSLKSELNKNKIEIIEVASKPIDTYQQLLKQNQQLLANRTDIASYILSGQDITQIASSIEKSSIFENLIIQKNNTYTANQLISTHFDTGVQQIINQSYQTPIIIANQKNIFKQANQDGLIKLTKQVYERQCRINP